jgi:tetratricopeptide (TPR) repeat protein
MNSPAPSPREMFERAVTLFNQGHLDAAEAICAELLPALPANAELAHFAGVLANRMGRHDIAAERLSQSVRLDPGRSRAQVALGLAWERLDRLEDARAALEAALRIEPAFAEAYNSLGIVEHRLGSEESALGNFMRALQLNPALAQARGNACHALVALGMADVHAGNSPRCIERMEAAIALDPAFHPAHALLGAELLATGGLRRGWREYLHRPTRGDAVLADVAAGRYPPALPADLRGRDIVLRGEQGLGDNLFFLRYAKPLADQGARLHARVEARLAPLIDRALPIATFEGAAPAAAVSIWIADLPLWVADLAAEPAPSLRIDARPEHVARVLDRLPRGNRPFIGVAWRAGTPAASPVPGQRLLAKEMDPRVLGTALARVEADIVVVQRQPEARELAALEASLGRSVIDLSAMNADLEDIHALMSVLDDYVGVSSTNIHLRAAAGRGGHVLVPHPAEWRWQRAGDSSPWFPDFRVHRQAPGGEWDAAIASLRKDLA